MPTIDLGFRLTGNRIPADHGYLLYGALSHVVPDMHRPQRAAGDDPETDSARSSLRGPLWEAVAVHPVNGQLCGGRHLALTSKSRLTLRVQSERIGELLPLAGKRLTVADGAVLVGVPEVHPLHPAPSLRCRLVTIKGFTEPGPFLDAVRRQLVALGIEGAPGLVKRTGTRSLEGRSAASDDRSPFVRRTLRIRNKEVVGYAVEVTGLDADESIRLQETGVGGRRRFGCGVFVPTETER